MMYFVMKRFLTLALILLLASSLLPPAWAAEGSGPAPTAAPSSAETPEPSPTPDPAIRFEPEAGLPLPCPEYRLTEKRPFVFGGTVMSEVPLTRVAVIVSDEAGDVLLEAEAVIDAEDETATCFPLWDRTFPFENRSLSARIDFAALKPGTYVFTLKAANGVAGKTVLYTAPFTVERTTALHTLIPNDLRDTYPAMAAYVGDDTLPFTYQSGTYNQIWVDNGWIVRNTTTIDTPFGNSWRVNKAAEEPFRQAVEYMRTTYVHVGGRWNSGVIRLSRLVRSYNGPFIGRQEENSPFLSPHVLGLAVDLNPGGPNEAVPDNWATFCTEISENLIYNGIQEQNGLKYYDFTYIGAWGAAYERVPTIIQNYLLYELAFYRAGFFWGVYYDHTCDASHFGLGEYDPEIFGDSPLALRKVFEYIDS